MASTMRSVDTRFWSDTWVRQLNALDRYAFLYFLTNQHSSWCGIYEVDLSMIAFETGIDEHDLKRSILPRLYPKVQYLDGWVYISNFEKYHENRSEKTKKGIENAWKEVPEKIRLKIKELDGLEIPHQRGMGGVSPSSSSFASSSAYNSDVPSPLSKEEKPQEISKDFFAKGSTYSDILKVFEKTSPHDFLVKEFDKFILYWTEPNGSGTKQRWQQQPTFDVKRRLVNWLSNVKGFSNNSKQRVVLS